MNPTCHCARMFVFILLIAAGMLPPAALSGAFKLSSFAARKTSTDVRSPHQRKEPDATVKARISKGYGKLPMLFEANRGQAGAQVNFIARGGGYALFLTPDEAVLRISTASGGERVSINNPAQAAALATARGTDSQSAVLRMKLVGANRRPRVSGIEPLQATSSYFIGDDPGKWRTNVANFAKVKYESVYPGVDLVWHGNQRQIEHDFIVAPGADPKRIKLSFAGADTMTIDGEGALVLRPNGNEDGDNLRLLKPVAWQEADGERREIACRFEITGSREAGFRLGDYDRSRTLVIDPVLAYSTYIGGAGVDQAFDIAVDSDGFAYITGQTDSTDFPGPSPVQSAKGAQTDVFVLKINQAGSAVVYGAWLGGQGADAGNEIAVNAAGNVFVAGVTNSDDFPTKNAPQPIRKGGTDAFVAKLNSAGNDLVYSTYVGGSLADSAAGLALDASGAAYLTGNTDSFDFPLMGAFQPAKKGNVVYSTTDGADSWNESSAGMIVSQVNDVVIDPKTPTTIYAGAERGLFKSADSGGSWTRIGGDQFNFFITLIAIDPVTPATIYALAGSLPYKSVDGGATWSRLTSAPTLQALVIDPAAPATLFGAGTSGQPFKSVDGGATWTPFNIRVPFGSNFAQIRSFVFDPANSSVVYAGGTGSVYKSADSGTTWTPLFNGFPTGFSFTVARLAISRSNPAVMFAFISNGGFYKTTNGGANWSVANFPLPFFPQLVIAIDPANANTVYAGTPGFGAYKTTDGGATWRMINNGLGSSLIRAIAIHPNAPSTVYLGTSSGADIFVTKLNPTGTALIYSSYLGGSGNDSAAGIAVDSSGNAYVAGTTQSGNLASAGSYQPSLKGMSDGFVAKINAAGTAVLWSTYLGGAGFDNASDIAIGPADSVIVAGTTNSTDFPTANALQPQNRSVSPATSDVFITRLSAGGSKLEFSTYLGGASFDLASGVAVDGAGAVYVTGYTDSADFPTLYAAQPKRSGDSQFPNQEAFAAKLSANGSSLIYSTYLGGNGLDQGNSIAVDAAGAAYLTGLTSSIDFPTTPNPLRGPGSIDSFVSKLSINADLAITIGDLPDPVMVNNQLTYRLTVVNKGVDAAAGVSVADTLPAGVNFVSATASQGSCAGAGPVNCSLGAIVPNGQATVTIIVTPTAMGTITNRAEATAATPDGDAANNAVTQETRVGSTPSIFGRVTTPNAEALGGVTVALTGAQKPPAVTGNDGGYQFAELPAGANYSVTPSRQGYVFNPANRGFNNLTMDGRADFTAVACVFVIAPATQTFSATGGSGSVAITGPDARCSWTAQSNAPWIKITSVANGNGDGTLTFSVEPSVGSRSGTITIAGNTFTVRQEFNACASIDFRSAPLFPMSDPSRGFGTPRLLARDFNSDGLPDVVFPTSGSGGVNNVAIAFANSRGGFEPQIKVLPDLGLPSEYVAIEAGDLNGDGKLDLVAAGATGFGNNSRVSVAFGDGTGKFAAPSNYTVSPLVIGVAVSDFNGDGKVDVVTINRNNSSNGTLSVLLNKGSGELNEARTLPFPNPFTVPLQIEIADFNTDGKPDLAILSQTADQVVIMRNDGLGGFVSQETLEFAFNSQGMAVGDFTGDGKNDVVAVSTSEIRVLPGKGDGSFDAPIKYPYGNSGTTILAEDLNGDGRPDWVVPGGESVAVIYANGRGSFDAPIHYFPGVFSGISFAGITAADFNRDGRRDIYLMGVTAAVGNALSLSVMVAEASGDFIAARVRSPFFDINSGLSLPAIQLATGDLNGDGNLDAVVPHAYNQVETLFGDGAGGFGAPVKYTVGDYPQAAVVRDFNGDGKPDIAVPNYGSANVTILFNDGAGRFPDSKQITTGSNGRALGVGDFNADGKPDLIVKSKTAGLALLIGNGGGDFTEAVASVAGSYPDPLFAVGDFNGDGNSDVAVFPLGSSDCRPDINPATLLLGDGRAGFRPPISFILQSLPDGIWPADLNGDGHTDLIVSSPCTPNEGLYGMLANADGKFGAPIRYETFNIQGLRYIVTGDVNGDALLDIVETRGNVSGPLVRLGKGTGEFSAPVVIPLSRLSGPVAVGDLNGDGANDLAVVAAFRLTTLINRTGCLAPNSVVAASSANYARYRVAAESIVASFGANLATTTQSATTLPLPTALANASVKIKDSAGVERLSPLFFVSPGQINHLIPPGTAPGAALVTVTNGANNVATGTAMITATTPGLFSADSSGQGLAAAVVLRVRPDNSRGFEPMVRFDSAQNKFVAIPIDLSEAAGQAFLLLFGTGLRNHSALANVNAKIGGENAEVSYAGAQGGFAGLDQMNLLLPRTLAGRGAVDVVVTVDGRAANTVRISIK